MHHPKMESALVPSNRIRLQTCLIAALFLTLWPSACRSAPPSATPPGEASAEVSAPARESNPGQLTGDKRVSTRIYVRPDDATLRARLSPLEWEVTQNDATEPPFRNRFWDHKGDGLYVDIVSGEPLFSSRDKFDSGTGWPSFTKPVAGGHVVEKRDVKHGMVRVEVRSESGDAHLGHVFPDGPGPSGLRYCINSASLRFVAAPQLAAEGYGAFVPLFATAGEPLAANTDNSCAAPPPVTAPGCESTLETAILAGGCFWGMEDLIRAAPGVLETEVGYTGGSSSDPSYEDVKTGRTGHAEALRVVFDPTKVSYAKLLEEWFFKMHDPTTVNRQGNDVGTQYRSAIFATSPEQAQTAALVKAKVGSSGFWKAPIATEIVPAGPFTPAESYHQDYLQKHPGGYTCHFMRR